MHFSLEYYALKSSGLCSKALNSMPFEPGRLKALRDAKGFSQEALAERAGVHQSVITRSEQGKSEPRGSALDKLASALDCTLDYLYGRSHSDKDASAAAAYMAFEVFCKSENVSQEQRIRCGRVIDHPNAPKTADGWRSLSDLIELAVGPTPSGTANLTIVKSRARSKGR